MNAFSSEIYYPHVVALQDLDVYNPNTLLVSALIKNINGYLLLSNLLVNLSSVSHPSLLA